jgi:hypothetical protein
MKGLTYDFLRIALSGIAAIGLAARVLSAGVVPILAALGADENLRVLTGQPA